MTATTTILFERALRQLAARGRCGIILFDPGARPDVQRLRATPSLQIFELSATDAEQRERLIGLLTQQIRPCESGEDPDDLANLAEEVKQLATDLYFG